MRWSVMSLPALEFALGISELSDVVDTDIVAHDATAEAIGA